MACTFAGCFAAGRARAEDMPRSVPPARQGASFDLRLSAGGASAQYRQHSYDLVDLDAVSISASMRWGGFIDSHVLVGYELLVGRHTDVGTPTVDPTYAGEFHPRPHEGYSIFSPLGAFAELYPIEGKGLYLGGSASVGLLSLPEFADEDNALMAGYAAEVGYDTSGSGKRGLGVFVRYSHWAGSAIISEHGDELSADEVSLGARWAFPMIP